MNLEQKRKEIDCIDAEIVALLVRRTEAARSIGELKTKAGLPIIDSRREEEVLRRIALVRPDGEGSIERIYRQILDESVRTQMAAVTAGSETVK